MSQITGRPDDGGARTDARDRLLGAAVEAFAARGFHGTTTRDIAAAAGMSPAALYVHHRSKEDLLFLISRSGHEATLQLVLDALASSEDPVEQLVAVVRAFTAHHARGHTRARIVNYELSALSVEHLGEIATLRRAIERHVRELVESGVAAGVFRTPDPRMTALALLSLGVDVARWYRDEGEWTPEEIAEHYCGLALRMVGR
ncbi:TetR/AcrR family transcriptional regulator [Nocardioides mesophilus]|uniref:TetR/AcrR family transcriptional regulator n=1 Tax=Nocardioides mesophilus TaxID=433659 RepID=A0A7G9RB19_9ACTN|nr:TetR/AcrR family transcriptional regulator [Nocardioides mesophilus]QNN52794.1 TetR/AcrR family transcriptional regulator [Nocardioides mesophilus]